MKVEVVLIVLSIIVIFSYLFDLLAKKTKVPSVVLLLLLGIGFQFFTEYFKLHTINFAAILPLLGTVGLVLIVLEGSMELNLDREKISLVSKSFFSALVILIITSLAIAFFFTFITGENFRVCLLNAIPLGIISSAIAIPTATSLPKHKKEFIIYESSFSDILGIVLFNFILINETVNFRSFFNLGVESIFIVILSAAFCIFLIYLLGRIQHHLKSFLIIAVLILVFAVGKYFHLSSLIIIMAFGIFLANAQLIRNPIFRNKIMYDRFKSDLSEMEVLTGESAFLVRTFFFLIFGYTIDLHLLISVEMLSEGAIVILIIYSIRFIYQRIVHKSTSLTEIFLSPRGLISILLYFSLPENLKLLSLENGLLFFVILASSLIMPIGLGGKKNKAEVAESEPNSPSTTSP